MMQCLCFDVVLLGVECTVEAGLMCFLLFEGVEGEGGTERHWSKGVSQDMNWYGKDQADLRITVCGD
jgi:hypothetical protein